MYGPLFIRDREKITNLNYIYNNNNLEVVNMLRMWRASFSMLVNTFRSKGLLEYSMHTTVEEQVAMFLHVVGHNQRFMIIHNTYKRSSETISRHFKQVLYDITEVRGEIIKAPIRKTSRKIHTSPRWYQYFKVSITRISCHNMLAMLSSTIIIRFHAIIGLYWRHRWYSHHW